MRFNVTRYPGINGLLIRRSDLAPGWWRTRDDSISDVIAWLDERGIKHRVRVGSRDQSRTFVLSAEMAFEFRMRWL